MTVVVRFSISGGGSYWNTSFTGAIPISQKLCDEYEKALQSRIKKINCQFCMNAHVMIGEVFRAKLKDVSTKGVRRPTSDTGGVTWESRSKKRKGRVETGFLS